MSLPSLAGLCSHEQAAQPGYNIEETVQLLVRYAWIKKRAVETSLHWLNPTPEWEAKEALSLHLFQDTEHAGLIRTRVSEMRNPPPRMDVSPDPALDRFFDELLTAGDTLEKVVGLYGVLRTALLEALNRHYDHANPLVDHPTRRILRFIILEERDTVAWGQVALDELARSPEAQARAAENGAVTCKAIWQQPEGSWAISRFPATCPLPAQLATSSQISSPNGTIVSCSSGISSFHLTKSPGLTACRTMKRRWHSCANVPSKWMCPKLWRG
jgi:hypothetical protein